MEKVCHYQPGAFSYIHLEFVAVETHRVRALFLFVKQHLKYP